MPDVVTAVRDVETALADGEPFGSHRYIADEVAAVYTRLLDFLAQYSAQAKRLVTGLDHGIPTVVLRDSLLRRTVEDGVCAAVQGLDTITPEMLDDLLGAAATRAEGGETLLDGDGRGVCLSPTAEHGYVWAGNEDSAVGRRFTGEIVGRIPQFRVLSPSRDQLGTLTRGIELASRVAPGLAGSALSHIFMVVLGEFESPDHHFNSFTLPGLPGVLVLSPDVLIDDASAAESLFHEAFHLKFLDIDYIRPLFAVGFRQETSPRVTPEWHEDDESGEWPVDRVLTSMHVYLALSVFLERAAETGVWQNATARSAQCRSRARWLHDAAGAHLACLTDSGRQFVSTIGALLDRLE